jgi:hypothetical protein
MLDDQVMPNCKKTQEDDGNFYYVNKNGFVQSQVFKTSRSDLRLKTDGTGQAIEKININNPLICTDLILDMYKNNIPSNKEYQKLVNDITVSTEDQHTRSVPSRLNQSSGSSNDCVSSNNSLVQRDNTGKYLIHTNLTIQEPSIDINNDHVKYVNIFSILCCFCFPVTGIIAILFSRSARKYYNQRDMIKAKKYLVKSEWMLIITIFFGCTIIGLVFGFLESFMFKNDSGEILQRGVYHSKTLN